MRDVCEDVDLEQHGRERAFKWICSAEHPASSDDVQWNGVRLKTVTTHWDVAKTLRSESSEEVYCPTVFCMSLFVHPIHQLLC